MGAGGVARGTSHSLSSPIHHPPKFSMSIMGCRRRMSQRRARPETYGPQQGDNRNTEVKVVRIIAGRKCSFWKRFPRTLKRKHLTPGTPWFTPADLQMPDIGVLQENETWRFSSSTRPGHHCFRFPGLIMLQVSHQFLTRS